MFSPEAGQNSWSCKFLNPNIETFFNTLSSDTSSFQSQPHRHDHAEIFVVLIRTEDSGRERFVQFQGDFLGIQSGQRLRDVAAIEANGDLLSLITHGNLFLRLS